MLRIGHVQLQTNLLLAPIAGYCDLAFRTICREMGGVGLACTDLLSPQGLLRGTAASLDLARTNDFDKPIGMQLYGSDPAIMAEGARWAVEHGATVVDINMGCPVDKVTKKDGGSKLLTDLSRAVAVAEAVARELEKCPLSAAEWRRRLGEGAEVSRCLGRGVEVSRCQGVEQRKRAENRERRTPGAQEPALRSLPSDLAPLDTPPPRHLDTSSPAPVPLTAKLRLCWSTDDYLAGRACSPHLAVALADVGVQALTVHGRTTEMKFGGHVQYEGIARVVEAVQRHARRSEAIPVIGNGDVREAADAAAMIARTGCQGVMIGRGALSTPWIFRDAWALQAIGRTPPEPTEAEKIALVRRFFALMRAYRDDHYAMHQIRQRISWFAKRLGGPGESVKPLKEAVRLAPGPEAVLAALDEFSAGGLRTAVERAGMPAAG